MKLRAADPGGSEWRFGMVRHFFNDQQSCILLGASNFRIKVQGKQN
jgi:hypothetical protein